MLIEDAAVSVASSFSSDPRIASSFSPQPDRSESGVKIRAGTLRLPVNKGAVDGLPSAPLLNNLPHPE
jgi:hypothetical protein